MALDVLPDSQVIAVQHLIGVSEIAAIVSTRVYRDLPQNPTYPLLRVFRIGGSPALQRRLDAASLQLEAWANTISDASGLARKAQAAMWELQSTVTPYGVVADVRDTLGLQYLPDPVTNKSRFIWGHELRARPL